MVKPNTNKGVVGFRASIQPTRLELFYQEYTTDEKPITKKNYIL